MEYRVERGAPRREAILRMWREDLGMSGDLDARWEWLYEGSPQGRAEVLRLMARGGGEERAVGCCALFPRRLVVAGVPRRAMLHADLAVDPEHRTLRPALVLLRAARAWAFERADLAYGFPNERSRPLFKRLRYQALGWSERWVYVLRHARYVGEAAGSRAVGRLAGPLLDGFRGLSRQRTLAARRRGTLVWGVPQNPPQVTTHGAILAGARSAQALTWRFIDEPGAQTRLLTWTRGQTQAMAAVSVVGAVAHLRDLVAPPEALRAFLDALVGALRAEGLESCSLDIAAPRVLRRQLAEAGFVHREDGPIGYAAARPGIELDAAEPWLTAYDHDTF